MTKKDNLKETNESRARRHFARLRNHVSTTLRKIIPKRFQFKPTSNPILGETICLTDINANVRAKIIRDHNIRVRKSQKETLKVCREADEVERKQAEQAEQKRRDLEAELVETCKLPIILDKDPKGSTGLLFPKYLIDWMKGQQRKPQEQEEISEKAIEDEKTFDEERYYLALPNQYWDGFRTRRFILPKYISKEHAGSFGWFYFCAEFMHQSLVWHYTPGTFDFVTLWQCDRKATELFRRITLPSIADKPNIPTSYYFKSLLSLDDLIELNGPLIENYKKCFSINHRYGGYPRDTLFQELIWIREHPIYSPLLLRFMVLRCKPELLIEAITFLKFPQSRPLPEILEDLIEVYQTSPGIWENTVVTNDDPLPTRPELWEYNPKWDKDYTTGELPKPGFRLWPIEEPQTPIEEPQTPSEIHVNLIEENRRYDRRDHIVNYDEERHNAVQQFEEPNRPSFPASSFFTPIKPKRELQDRR